MRIKAFYRMGKISIAAVIWFFSSLIVGPIYWGLIVPVVIKPKTGFQETILMLGGAIAWYLIIYVAVSILFQATLRRRNRPLRQEST